MSSNDSERNQGNMVDPKHGYVAVNGVDYYYEIHGEGEPLLLLHGGLGSFEMFQPILPLLTETRQVIGVDLHGHGHTALGDRTISLVDMGDDMALLIRELGYHIVDVVGYSLGAGVAFQMAVQHPECVRKLVLASAALSRDSFYPEILEQQSQVGAEAAAYMVETPMYQTYVSSAPKPEDFPRLLDEMGRYMSIPYDWSDDVAKLIMPTLLIYGDSDMFQPEHVIKFYQLLGGGLKDAGWDGAFMTQNQLAILPGRSHYNVFLDPRLATTALVFLDEEAETQGWSA